jgi:hypothetical protein
MISAIRELVQFYAQQFHVPIECASETWELETWDKQGLLIGMPSATPSGLDKEIDGLKFGHDPAFGKDLGGDFVILHDVRVARVSKQFIIFRILPTNKAASDLARHVLDQYLPRMCRDYRHAMRDQLVGSITECVKDRKKELESSVREDSFELERMSLQMMQMARKLETDRQILRLFEKAPDWIKARATRTFVDLMKLVPGTYASFRIQDDSVVGVTHDITIEHEGTDYHFDQYEVEVDLRQGKVFIGRGSNINGYVHPHVTEERSNICWGNVAHLVERLVAELDLFGLFQLIDTFLKTYNPNDPYQRIEKWNPDWQDEEDDDEPYCSWCDSYGHEISECEHCWYCPHCEQYDDHDEEHCPNRPQEQTEEVIHAVDETPA